MAAVCERVTGTSFDAEAAVVAGRLNAEHARLVDLAVRAAADGGWAGAGIHSLPHWLTIRTAVSPARAHQVARIAERIDSFVQLREAFYRGELSIDQVDAVVAHAPAWADEQVTELARECTVRQLRRVMRDEFFEPDPDDDAEPSTDDDPEPNASEHLSFGWRDNGQLWLSAVGDTDRGMLVEAALNEAHDALFRAGSTDVTWYDALAEVCERSLQSAPVERRERFKSYLHFHIDNGRTQLTNGVPLPDNIRKYLTCDGQVQPIWEIDNVAVGLGRSQRIVPTRLRRLIEHRDQHCRVPGCGARHLEIYHLRHWSNGGPTETWNLAGVCHRHHRLHHQGVLGIEGNADQPDGLVFTDANGRILDYHGRPKLPTGPPPEPDGHFMPPSGGQLHAHWVQFNRPKMSHRVPN